LIFWSKCDSIPTLYCPRGNGDWRMRSQNGFYTAVSPIMQSAEEYIQQLLELRILGRKSKLNRHSIPNKKSNRNQIERKKPQSSRHYLSAKLRGRTFQRVRNMTCSFTRSTLGNCDVINPKPNPNMPNDNPTNRTNLQYVVIRVFLECWYYLCSSSLSLLAFVVC